MNADASSLEEGEGSIPRIDLEILNAALELLDQGEEPSLAALVSRFGERDEDIRAALEAVESYRQHLTGAKHLRDELDHVGLEPGSVLGDYTITGLLGRGAMGVVYRARQGALGGREVALKVLPSELIARDPRFLERFRREAKLAARIHAPNVAEVHDFGSANGQFYIAMRLVDGPSLADVLEGLARHRRLGVTDHTRARFVRQIVRLVRDLARALAAVHAAGLVHRDVKPSNVIVERTPDADPNTLVGNPILVDFGLLRPENSSDLTGTMTVLGTAAYAPQEVRLGHGASARSDVFSLGVLLHDSLTLTRPVDRAAASAGLDEVRAMNPGVDARLSAIVSKATETKPGLRYADGKELADDLDRYLRGVAVHALPSNVFGRIRLWGRRSPKDAFRVSGLLILTVLFLTLLGWYGAWAWKCTKLAGVAVEYERTGVLTATATTFQDLASTKNRWMLPWLDDEFARASRYDPAKSPLRHALSHLTRGERSLDENDLVGAESEFAQAYDRFCVLLFDSQRAELHGLIRQCLLHEVDPVQTECRRRRAMDAWANYLSVQPDRPSYPEKLPSVLRDCIEDREHTTADTREAAISALGAIPTQDDLSLLIEQIGDPDLGVSLRACYCAIQCYSLIHFHSADTEFPGIDRALMTRWATRFVNWYKGLTDNERQNTDVPPAGYMQVLFWHLACFEMAVDGSHTGALNVPEDARRLIDRAREDIEKFLATEPDLNDDRDDEDGDTSLARYRFSTGRATFLHSSRMWTPPEEDCANGLSLVRTSECEDYRGLLDFQTWNQDKRPRVSGTVLSARCTGAEYRPDVSNSTENRAHLRLWNPGLSSLHIHTSVPHDACALTVRVFHTFGTRSNLRNRGRVTCRLSIVGEPCETIAIVSPTQNFDPLRATEDVLARHQDIEISLEYLFGNTSYWIRRVELEWDTANPSSD